MWLRSCSLKPGMSAAAAPRKRLPGTLAERFWSLAHSAGVPPEDTTDPDPKAIVRHVLCILDLLAAGEIGDGVSHASVSFLQLLRQHEAMGDLSYASPEQARGETIDERSLVFSVGVLLFEEMTGRHPFGRETARRFARIKKGELGSGVQYFPQVPTELRSVLVQAMGPFPEERFASLAELREALEAFLASKPAEPGDEDRTRHFRRPVMIAPGISLPADAFSATLPHAPAAHAPPASLLQSLPPPLPMSRTLASPLLSTPFLPPVRKQRSRASAVAERVGWLVLGGVVALAASKLPSLFSHASAVVASPVAVVTTVAPVTPVARAADPAAALEAPAPAQVVSQPPALEPRFDAAAAARAGAEAARKCFERIDHTIAFGAGLLFAPDDAEVRRAFLSPDEIAAPEARRCVQKALVGADAGAPPDARIIVEARFKLRPDGTDEIRVKSE
jgi:hypothetical protein